jgi:hypothetical protein
MQPKPTKTQATTPNTFQPVGAVVARIVERALANAKAKGQAANE